MIEKGKKNESIQSAEEEEEGSWNKDEAGLYGTIIIAVLASLLRCCRFWRHASRKMKA